MTDQVADDLTNRKATMNGSELIAAERQRQIEVEGWTAEHDAEHRGGDLTEAAICYAIAAASQARGYNSATSMRVPHMDRMRWPWDGPAWKPSEDPIRNLTKAGALIAAEIDRLNHV